MDNLNIAVISAGNGGTAMAAYMTLCGAKVRLSDLFPKYLEGIQSEGITLELDGRTRLVRPSLITSDLKAALDGAALVMVVTPAFTHQMIARACAPFLTDGQVVVLNPGRTAGALDFLNTLRAEDCERDVVVAETQTLIYSCRRVGPTAVQVYGTKESVDISAFPGERIDEVLRLVNACYPQFHATQSVLGTSLANIGSMFHPAPVLLNVGRIENDERGFRYYWDGITPSVAKLIERMDAERLAVGAAYDTPLLSAADWLTHSYGVHGATLYERIHANTAYGDIRAPGTIDARYMTDDVPNGLVPIEALGRAAGVATPAISAVITLAGCLYGKDFRAEGRSLENLGISGMGRDEILRYFQTGKNHRKEANP